MRERLRVRTGLAAGENLLDVGLRFAVLAIVEQVGRLVQRGLVARGHRRLGFVTRGVGIFVVVLLRILGEGVRREGEANGAQRHHNPVQAFHAVTPFYESCR
jgi:hypothetical protein